MYNFCTLFDKNYLYKGLALYNSLKRHSGDFKLFILCMDDITYNLLHKMTLEDVELISLKEFEDSALLQAKTTRTWAEYCWTCTASLMMFLFKNYPALEMITYLDADLYFFHDPKPFFDELNNNSILITESNLSQEYRRLLIYGKYSVQFNIFRNNEEGLKALEWWRKKTINWCYSRRRGKNMQGGDQIYLNDWPSKFKGVHVLRNKKLCLTPLNINKYHIFLQDNTIYVEDIKLIFYHFHSFEMHSLNKFTLADGAYLISRDAYEIIYKPYLEEIQAIFRNVKQIDPTYCYGFVKRKIKKILIYYIKKIFYSVYRWKINQKISC